MTTNKTSRFFGLIPLRPTPERTTPEHPVPERSMPEQPVPSPAPLQHQAYQDAAAGLLMRALHLTSHADELRLTEQEKRTAWELPARTAESDEAIVPRSTSKARMLIPALEQMRQTQSTLMSGNAPGIEDNIAAEKTRKVSTRVSSAQASTAAPKKRRTARPKQTPEPTQQAAAQEQAPAPSSIRPKPARKQKPVTTPTQVPPATSHGWQYSVTLQHAENSAPSSAPQSIAPIAPATDASSISSMFERLRSHSEKPSTPPATAPKAPGFLSKLWAK